MWAHKLKTIIASFLIFSQLVFWPVLVLAQTANIVAPLNPVPISDSGSLIANNAFNTALLPIQKIYSGCNSSLKDFEATDNATNLGFSFSTLIGGDGKYVAQLGKEIGTYQIYLYCLQGPPLGLASVVIGLPDGILPALNNIIAPNLYTSNIKQQMVAEVNVNIQTYKAKLVNAQARYNAASQNVWKALLITILLNTTKAVANQLVYKLVNNYKISNLMAYTNSLATLAYDNQFVRANFPDAQSQIMARQILTNPALRTQIQPGMYIQANNSLAFNPATLSTSNPNFYANMGQVGSSQANPYFLQSSFVAGVDQSRASSLAMAQNHISQGNGYKAPVSCAGSLAQQRSLDLQNKALSDQLANRQTLLNNLLNAAEMGQDVKQADITKASADLKAAQDAWNNSPDALNKGNPAVVMCEAVASPAVLVNQGIDALFKSVSANMSQYNSNNLPGYLSAIGGTASQIGSSMILGGVSGGSTVNENQALGQAVAATTAAGFKTLNDNQSANLAKGVIINFDANTGVDNSYTISWQIVDTQIPTASYVTLSGDGVAGASSVDPKTQATVLTKLPLNGSNAVTTTKGGTYTLTVYDASGKVLTTATSTLTPTVTVASSGGSGGLVCNGSYSSVAECVAQNGQDYCNTLCGSVHGAFTDKPVLSLRGPVEHLSPRGQ